MNDPSCGPPTELEKTDNAYKAIDVFWQLFDLLGYWAQCHLAALAQADHDNEFVSSVLEENPEIHQDCHLIEDLGQSFLAGLTSRISNDEKLDRQKEKEDLETEGQKNQILRQLIFDLLGSKSQQSATWRFPLLRSMRALNNGQYDPLLIPRPQRRIGRSFDLDQWKLEAVLQVHFRVGGGWKKYRALEVVSEGIGQSIDAIRDWEKELKNDRDYLAEMACAEIAGRHEEDYIKGYTIGFPEYRMHKGRPMVEIARDLLPHLKNRTFVEIAAKLRENRTKGIGG